MIINFLNKSLIELQLPIHLFKLITNGQHLTSTEFESMRVGLIHGSLFNDTPLVGKDLIKFNNAVNISLISLNIILYYS